MVEFRQIASSSMGMLEQRTHVKKMKVFESRPSSVIVSTTAPTSSSTESMQRHPDHRSVALCGLVWLVHQFNENNQEQCSWQRTVSEVFVASDHLCLPGWRLLAHEPVVVWRRQVPRWHVSRRGDVRKCRPVLRGGDRRSARTRPTSGQKLTRRSQSKRHTLCSPVWPVRSHIEKERPL